jgi:hypothetical protein
MSNTLTTVIPQILAKGLQSLRENTIMPHLVNTGHDSEAGERGSTITIPVPASVTTKAVSPSSTPATSADITTSSVTITMDQWYEAPFTLTDKDQMEIMKGFFPLQAQAAIKSLANHVDQALLNLYKDIYGKYGTPGTTPFASSTTDANQVRKILNQQLAPIDDRRIVLGPAAEANALDLRAFQDVSFSGDARSIIEGRLTRKLGFDWFMDQNVRDHTVGSLGGTTADPTTVDGVNAIGDSSLSANVGTTNALALKDGDIITIAGDTQTYVVTADTTCTAAGTATIPISPTLKVATSGAEVITLEGDGETSYPVNLAFHRDCIAFASRPLKDLSVANPNIFSMIDPISGISLRLEVDRQNKQDRWSFDILYGLAVVRPELGCRLHG